MGTLFQSTTYIHTYIHMNLGHHLGLHWLHECGHGPRPRNTLSKSQRLLEHLGGCLPTNVGIADPALPNTNRPPRGAGTSRRSICVESAARINGVPGATTGQVLGSAYCTFRALRRRGGACVAVVSRGLKRGLAASYTTHHTSQQQPHNSPDDGAPAGLPGDGDGPTHDLRRGRG